MTAQRTTAEIAADLADYRAARSALVKGERVERVARGGRLMQLASLSLSEIETAISLLEREYDAAANTEAGKPRRVAIGTVF